jgi:hypothetical protein
MENFIYNYLKMRGLVILLIIIGISTCFKDLPSWARGGSLYKELYPHHQEFFLEDSKEVESYWDSKIDNFDPISKSTFKQRYFIVDTYWDKTAPGPVFFEIGGEGDLRAPTGGYMEDLAKKHKALLVALEHRFYGKSIPNNSVATENLYYLTVEQALADLKNFTIWFKDTVLTGDQKKAKWFVFGGSYPGALASWYRKQYPEQSEGSLSSSGVVNCIVDYYGFDQAISAAAGNACANNILRLLKAFQDTIESSDGLALPLSLFDCEDDMDKTDFYYMIADSYSMHIQYNKKTLLCDTLNFKEGTTNKEIMTTFATMTKTQFGADFCRGGFYNTKQAKDAKRWVVNSRSWRYQTCAQVSYFNTSPQRGSLRHPTVNLAYHLQQCEDMFGIKNMYPASDAINNHFGGAFPTATNVFYSNFSDDPWQRASVDFSPSPDQPYFLTMCENCGHCSDFHKPLDTDHPNLKKTREEFEKYLVKWLDLKPTPEKPIPEEPTH